MEIQSYQEMRGVANGSYKLENSPEDIKAQFSDPLCGEMLNRWDMLEASLQIY